jgi:hypothetical protein
LAIVIIKASFFDAAGGLANLIPIMLGEAQEL